MVTSVLLLPAAGNLFPLILAFGCSVGFTHHNENQLHSVVHTSYYFQSFLLLQLDFIYLSL